MKLVDGDHSRSCPFVIDVSGQVYAKIGHIATHFSGVQYAPLFVNLSEELLGVFNNARIIGYGGVAHIDNSLACNDVV